MGHDQPKQFLQVARKPLLAYALETFCQARFLSRIVVVAPFDYREQTVETVSEVAGRYPRARVDVVDGGAERQDSVFNALQALPADCEWVVIHDGVRPLVSLQLIEQTWRAALESGAAIAAVPATDTVKRVRDAIVMSTLPREQVWLVQTPQVFRADLLQRAYREARESGISATDDASLVERLGLPVHVVIGERTNVKVTTPEDLSWVEWFLTQCR